MVGDFWSRSMTYQTTATQPENGMSFRCYKKDSQCQGSFKLHTYPTPSNDEVLLPLCLHSFGAEIPTLENVITKFEGLLDGSIKKINNRKLENTTAHYCTFLKKHKDWYIEKAGLRVHSCDCSDQLSVGAVMVCHHVDRTVAKMDVNRLGEKKQQVLPDDDDIISI
jgi:hypothetical protein